ncbi:MAG: flavodoxin family protein [Succiniclasticum sp.]|jgi:flavin reductase|nr:flavodoxin family protein [Selenomonadales bacterium]MDY6303011.1 flavodoxin family protein [Succiniclasticum sp.]MDY6346762.1 flavodoxin family protein [Succiniclasticum sp.]
MKIIAINGSPRRTGNTATFLHKALEGAASVGADTECIDLYSLNYKGCLSCFYCKRKDKEHGTCIIKDDLAPVLEKVKAADAVLFGSPIYFMNITSGMQAFLERLLFSLYIYSREIPSVLGKKLPSAFLYTMNATEERAQEAHLLDSLAPFETFAATILGTAPRKFYAFNTLQFKDYSQYESSIFSEADKKAYYEKHIAEELQQAYELGRQLVMETKRDEA